MTSLELCFWELLNFILSGKEGREEENNTMRVTMCPFMGGVEALHPLDYCRLKESLRTRTEKDATLAMCGHSEALGFNTHD